MGRNFFLTQKPVAAEEVKVIQQAVVQERGGFLGYKLIHSTAFTLTVFDIVLFLIVVIGTLMALKVVKRAITQNKRLDEGKQYALYNLTKYFLVTVAFIVVLQLLGVNLALLIGGSAALLVGIGLGLQTLFSDFVSGLILLIDSSIKVGDVILVDDLVCKVNEINLRTTQVITRDDKYILLPNSMLTKNNIVKWTNNQDATRFSVDILVGYESDANLVRELLLSATEGREDIEKEPEPFVRLTGFSEANLHFRLSFWSTNVFRIERTLSDIRFDVFDKLKTHGIAIALPQVRMHVFGAQNRDASHAQPLADESALRASEEGPTLNPMKPRKKR